MVKYRKYFIVCKLKTLFSSSWGVFVFWSFCLFFFFICLYNFILFTCKAYVMFIRLTCSKKVGSKHAFQKKRTLGSHNWRLWGHFNYSFLLTQLSFSVHISILAFSLIHWVNTWFSFTVSESRLYMNVYFIVC